MESADGHSPSNWRQVIADTLRRQHRLMIVLEGDDDWGRALATELSQASDNSVWLSDSAPELANVPAKGRTDQWLGRETHWLVVDCFSGFDPDAIGALSGTLVAGGVLLFIVPKLAEWSNFNDPYCKKLLSWPDEQLTTSDLYLSRVSALFQKKYQQQSVINIRQADMKIDTDKTFISELSAELYRLKKYSANRKTLTTADQQSAISIIKALQKKTSSLMLTADRGRGKSSAMGISAASYLAEGKSVLVTGPRTVAADEVFFHAEQELAKIAPDLESNLKFIAPDLLLQEKPKADLLLVDEAAAIPLPMLLQMLAHWPSIVFASTTHGYEGSGRGFSLKFSALAASSSAGWQTLEMFAPIRWGEGDPTEQFISQLLLMDAEPSSLNFPAKKQLADKCAVEINAISAEALVNDEKLLQQTYGLLVQAHYQTQPSDLRLMLGNPKITILLARATEYDHLVVGVLLAIEEGGFPVLLAQDIWLGKRRPRGHLLAQSLAAHAGYKDAPLQKGLRVSRIAVLPQFQQHNVGSQLLQKLKVQADGYDWLGTSFAASAALVDFWHKNLYQAIRMGISKDAASGHHSLQMLLPLSAAACEMTQCLSCYFNRQLPELIAKGDVELDTDLQNKLIKLSNASINDSDKNLLALDWLNLISFSRGYRSFELSRLSIALLLDHKFRKGSLSQQQLNSISNNLQVPKVGKKSWLKQLRKTISAEVEHELESELVVLWKSVS
ncbi:tRNA(Met) cytidine acetyltransferase TmcA [Pelagibaculum spongiae]|uniref:tRNA(Met) cytidine acetyltransferase TmcA n=1 Tax=Pelagibaculum spongiae TaxID=2080658 RepID=A0A2V1GZC4_9GAMM|nr:GNAT family N-acetyltransferase [Pelagibaculum spongiae]PVZ72421.1 hypothetical protein DC094_05295 [Pelagibaculum spongiae]